MTIDVTDRLSEQQEITIALGGTPANSLQICTGKVALDLSSQDRNFIFNIGPQLGQNQFNRAIASAGFGTLTITTMPMAPPPEAAPMGMPGGTSQCGIAGIDADWDDESGRIRIRLDITDSSAGMAASGQLTSVNYTVHIVWNS